MPTLFTLNVGERESFFARSQELSQSKQELYTFLESGRKSSRLEGKEYVKISLASSTEDISCSNGSDKEYMPAIKRRRKRFFWKARKHKKNKTHNIKMDKSSSEDLTDMFSDWNKDKLFLQGLKESDEKSWSSESSDDNHRTGIDNNVENDGTSHESFNKEQHSLSKDGFSDEKNLIGNDIGYENKEARKEILMKWKREICNKEKISKKKCVRETNKLKMRRKVFEMKKSRLREYQKKNELSNPLRFQSFPCMLKVLLSLLYLAVLLSGEHILLMDLLRWCHEGHIPYLSAPCLVELAMKSRSATILQLKKMPSIPDSRCVRRIAGELSLFLCLHSIPLPCVKNVIAHLVKLLRLPEQVTAMSQELVTLKEKTYEKTELMLEVPCVESLAMASVVVTLKMCCGINDLVEHQLSAVTSKINSALGSSHTVDLLFSWDDWKRYITKLLWFCNQVYPLHGMMSSASKAVGNKQVAIFSRLSQILSFCRCAPAVHMKDLKDYTHISSMLDDHGHSLRKLFDQHKVYRGTADPFLGIIEQYVTTWSENDPQSPELLKIGQDLMQMSFASHQLFWTQNITHIQRCLKKCGSKIVLNPVKFPNIKQFKDATPLNRIWNYKKIRSDKVLKQPDTYFEHNEGSTMFMDNSSDSTVFDDNSNKRDTVYCSTGSLSDSSVSLNNGNNKKKLVYSLTERSSDFTTEVKNNNTNFVAEESPSCSLSAIGASDLVDKIYTSNDSSSDSEDYQDKVDKIFRNEYHPSSNILLVPMPLYRFWKSNLAKEKWKYFWENLPINFQWLITVGSTLCLISKEELIKDVNLLEKTLVLHCSR
ncbi:uncharacterized protein [Cherax quadricarinatus]